MAFQYLSDEDINSVLEAVESAGMATEEARTDLLATVDIGYAASLPRRDSPLDQIASDLRQMNRVESLDKGQVPLREWLKQAIAQTHRESRVEEEAFQAVLEKLRPKPDQAEGECPYRGLQFFTEDHTLYFFGRQAMTEKLLVGLEKSNFLIVVGPSGSGKSSLVRAGLIPALKHSGQPWLCPPPFTPGKAPLDSLATALVDLAGPQALGDRVEQIGKIAAEIRGDATAAPGLSHNCRALHPALPCYSLSISLRSCTRITLLLTRKGVSLMPLRQRLR